MPEHVYNIPFGVSFVDVLSKRFLSRYKEHPAELANVLFLVQNRRAVLSLKEAFLRQNGLKPFLLPKIVALADIDEDEFFLQDCDCLTQSAVSAEERLFLFARLISSKHDAYGIKDISFVQALSLASDLAKLIDGIYNENLKFEDLSVLVPEEYAAHWQETLKFLKIVTAFWPDILKERGLIDPSCKKNKLLKLKASLWLKNPPKYKIVAAGLNAAFDGIKDILSCINQLENGEIYIYGLDRYIENEVFENLSETHSQFENKSILELLKLEREDVTDIAKSENSAREIFISEMMRPADTTADWAQTSEKFDFEQAFNQIHLIECTDNFEEAASIALIMRDVLQTPEKTAVLVTPDRDLARSVSAALKRFGIDIDDSAGLPLHLSNIGIYLRQIIDVLDNDFLPSSVAALLKNPYVRLNKSEHDLRKSVRDLELKKRMPYFDKMQNDLESANPLTDQLKENLKDLGDLYQNDKVSLKALILAHIKTAEILAQNDEMSGADNLWRFDDGRACAAYLAKLIEKADIAGDIDPKTYGAVLTTLLSMQSVRKTYGTHPRLKILGPIEARFNHYDVTIVGGLNEGIWPLSSSTDPFMSHQMKKDYGLALPERAVGVAAFDLSALMGAGEVYLTRCSRTNGAPTNKSRYWLRLETIFRIFQKEDAEIKSLFYQTLAKKLNTPDNFITIAPVAPKPPVSSRPRLFSASSIEKLMRNPYEIYARYILKLKVLDDLNEDIKQTTYGTAVHRILEKFALEYNKSFDDRAYQYLIKLSTEEFARYNLGPKDKAFWNAKFKKTAGWVVQIEREYRQSILRVFPEVKGQIEFDMPSGKIVIEARADRLDETKENKYCILDYKTGQIRSKAEIKSGYAPQLSIEALIALNGGFLINGQTLPAKKIDRLIYWQLGKKILCYDEDIDDLMCKTEERLKRLISAFDFETTPYLARPNPRHLDAYADYEHLARIKEWGEGTDDE